MSLQEYCMWVTGSACDDRLPGSPFCASHEAEGRAALAEEAAITAHLLGHWSTDARLCRMRQCGHFHTDGGTLCKYHECQHEGCHTAKLGNTVHCATHAAPQYLPRCSVEGCAHPRFRNAVNAVSLYCVWHCCSKEGCLARGIGEPGALQFLHCAEHEAPSSFEVRHCAGGDCDCVTNPAYRHATLVRRTCLRCPNEALDFGRVCASCLLGAIQTPLVSDEDEDDMNEMRCADCDDTALSGQVRCQLHHAARPVTCAWAGCGEPQHGTSAWCLACGRGEDRATGSALMQAGVVVQEAARPTPNVQGHYVARLVCQVVGCAVPTLPEGDYCEAHTCAAEGCLAMCERGHHAFCAFHNERPEEASVVPGEGIRRSAGSWVVGYDLAQPERAVEVVSLTEAMISLLA